MTDDVPMDPKIYHIVHVGNLKSIVSEGCLWSDAVVAGRQGITVIGMGGIKKRRLESPVPCRPGTRVGDYVPFYLCPRSIMLYVIHRANHPELAYRGGQQPIVHLEADLRRVVRWAEANDRRWAFSTINAAHGAAEFYCKLESLDAINWTAIGTHAWTGCRDEKQAEFLAHEAVPWMLFDRIGVCAARTAQLAYIALGHAAHRPPVEIKPDWYY